MKAIPFIALVLCISGIVLGASVITLTKFGDTVSKCYNTSYHYNTSIGVCDGVNATAMSSIGKGSLNWSNEYYAILQAKEGQNTIAEQLPTVAIIGVMVIIISIIAGVFVYLRYFG